MVTRWVSQTIIFLLKSPRLDVSLCLLCVSSSAAEIHPDPSFLVSIWHLNQQAADLWPIHILKLSPDRLSLRSLWKNRVKTKRAKDCGGSVGGGGGGGYLEWCWDGQMECARKQWRETGRVRRGLLKCNIRLINHGDCQMLSHLMMWQTERWWLPPQPTANYSHT